MYIRLGIYPKIYSSYSEDLIEVIKLLLQISPKNRPSCEELLKNPIITKHGTTYNLLETTEEIDEVLAKGGLLGTIKVPANLNILREKLPKPNYNNKK